MKKLARSLVSAIVLAAAAGPAWAAGVCIPAATPGFVYVIISSPFAYTGIVCLN